MLDPKPIYKDSTRQKALYIGGNRGKQLRENNLDNTQKSYSIDFLEAEISRGSCGEHTYSSIGAFTYGGIYDARPIDPENLRRPVLAGQKWFAGGGIDLEYGYKVSIKKAEIRAIGLKANLYYEDGSYAEFRQEVDDASAIGQLYNFNRVDQLITNANSSGVGYNLLATHEFILLLKNGTFNFTLSNGFGAGVLTSSFGLGFSKMNVHFGINVHANFDGTFMNASLRFRLPKKS